MRAGTVRLGVMGCGRFARFAVGHFLRVPGVVVSAVADSDPGAARDAARRFGCRAVESARELVALPEVELVYVATPPFLHYRHAMMALEAGKHVLCEKPLALTLEQADQMMLAARRRGLLLVANMMQRYNPLFEAVRAVLEERLLGEPLHGFFENYAKDEDLPPGHWFWDRARSGGIFVEHGVHFFDLFAGWLGEGRVESASSAVRPGAGLEEHVCCTVRYGQSVLVGFYHGFHQPERLDRQEMRLVFERGDVTLYGWIPTAARVRALVDERTEAGLRALFPGARWTVLAAYEGEQRRCAGRGKRLEAVRLVELACGSPAEKLERYGELLRALLRDQIAWLRDTTHRRRVTAEHGRAALAMALEADRLARG